MISSPPRILVAGIGNIFLGDDAFGVHVARRLLSRQWPAGVRVVDLGIRGLDLVYALLDGAELAILIDALPRGEPPGTLFVFEPQPPQLPPGATLLDAHSLDPAKALAIARSLGGATVGRTLVVGCEPSPLDAAGDDEMQMGLSAPVQAAIGPAVQMIESLIARHLAGQPPAAGPLAGQPLTMEDPHVAEAISPAR